MKWMITVTVILASSLSLFGLLRVTPQVTQNHSTGCATNTRPFTTEGATFCLPLTASVTRKTLADVNVATVRIPDVEEPLLIARGLWVVDESDEIYGSPLFHRIEEKPRVKKSSCSGFLLLDARWIRADGWHAREVITAGVAAGYDWSPSATSRVLDAILDTLMCGSVK
jgi:hypothetical protein